MNAIARPRRGNTRDGQKGKGRGEEGAFHWGAGFYCYTHRFKRSSHLQNKIDGGTIDGGSRREARK